MDGLSCTANQHDNRFASQFMLHGASSVKLCLPSSLSVFTRASSLTFVRFPCVDQ